MADRSTGGDLVAIQKAYDLAKEMTERTRQLPRDLRFVLGDRMLNAAYDVLELLLEARYTRRRRALLARANVTLERLRYQARLCMEERLISLRQYEYLAEMISETGRLVGGWLKKCDT